MLVDLGTVVSTESSLVEVMICVVQNAVGIRASEAWYKSAAVLKDRLIHMDFVPKEFMLMRRGPSYGHGVGSRGKAKFQSSAKMRGLSLSSHTCGGIRACSRICMAFTKPATPLAPSRWPMLALMEPTHNGLSRGRALPNVAPRADVSIGSPAAVPVP